MKYNDVALGASNLLLGTAVGAGVNQSVFVMPGWFSSPPESIAKAQESAPFKSFWIPLQTAAALALGAAFALNRNNRRRRGLLSAALGLYVATWASTGAYFAPEIIRLARAGDELPRDEAGRRGRRWQAFTWARHAALAGAWVLTATALTPKPRRLPL